MILAGGGIALLLLQLFVLRHFCLFCALHSVTAIAFWIVLLFQGNDLASGHAPMFPLIIILGGFVPGLIILDTQSSNKGEEVVNIVDTSGIDSSACFNWFGQPQAHDPIVVLSVSCPHCLDVLSRWQKANRMDETRGPKLFFYAQTNLELTQLFVACVVDGNGRLDKKAFSRMVEIFPDLEDGFMMQDASQLRNLAATQFPGYESRLPRAEQTLRRQQGQLRNLHISAVPYFVDANSLVRPLLNDTLIWNN